MQTFLPVPDFHSSVILLDSKRLGKQRVEAKQIYLALTLPNYGWKHHPATKMWRGYTDALLTYGEYCCEEWIARGNKDSLLPFFRDEKKYFSSVFITLPDWLGKQEFHASHRSNLLRKDPSYYGAFHWTEPPNLPYWWPTDHGYGCPPASEDLQDDALPHLTSGQH